ncbi:MAG TPA: hypothetical protein VN643_14880 [Pyrinomonadaceae bacterium]|nr:hypothetical protein [Pyrinomonadaceae bacterium]
MNFGLGKRVLVLFAVLTCTAASASAAPDQPKMREARQHLVAARTALQRADANKGGHRMKAIGYVNSAIAEIDLGIRFDRRNNHAVMSTPDQPNMRTALDELNQAKNSLDAATNDKGGHKVKAIALINDAIREVNAGIAAAN